jgi:hypothetical protein
MVGVAPYPDKDRETEADALVALAEVVTAVSAWRDVALVPVVALSPYELDDLAPTFEQEQMAAAWRLQK